MADWLGSLRGGAAGRGAPAKNVAGARHSSSSSLNSRQASALNEECSSSTRDDVDSCSTESRAGSKRLGKARDQDPLSASQGSQKLPLKTPRRRGAGRPPTAAAGAAARPQEPNAGAGSPPGSPRGSARSIDDMSVVTDDDLMAAGEPEGDCVQVCVRVRPVNDSERRDASHQPCISVMGTRALRLYLQRNRTEPHLFQYDNVFTDEAPQQEVFEVAGCPVVENCLNGYNSTIFAYGQTGAGKTHTMLGHLGSSSDRYAEMRGLAPRVFEYLFSRIAENEDSKGRDNVTYSCRCSFLEIYNESITDLLNPSATNLQIREDIKKGCYVDGLSEESVVNVEEMLALMRKGAENRHVGETRMNKESSRSHSVFTCTLERCSKSSNGLTNIVFSRLNLIDLAGSERQKKSEVAGSHLKEACHINKSLTILGRVIHELVEAQRSGRKSHVPYRDSRLTFLLQDSLGGNAKTWIIANVSPSSCCSQETLSTLQFAQRAKRIRNRAVVNMDTRGDAAVLQKEIARLNNEIHNIRAGATDAYVTENGQLRGQLKEQERQHQDTQLRLQAVQAEVVRYKRERDRAEARMLQFQASQAALAAALARTDTALRGCEQATAAAHATEMAVASKEAEALQLEKQQLQQQVAGMDGVHEDLQMQLAGARGVEAQLREELQQEATARQELHASLRTLQQQHTQLSAELHSKHSTVDGMSADMSALQQECAAKEQALVAAQEELQRERDTSAQFAGEVQGLEAQLSAQATELAAALGNIQALRTELGSEQQGAEQLRGTVSDQQAQLAAARQELQAAAEQAGTVQADLSSTQTLLQQEKAAVLAVEGRLASMEAQLQEQRAAHESVQQSLSATQSQLQEEQASSAALRDEVAGLQSQLAQEHEQHTEERATTDATWSCKAQALEAQVEVLQQDLQAVRLTNEQVEADKHQLASRVAELSEQLATAHVQLQAEREAHVTAEGGVSALRAELVQLGEQLASEKVQLSSLLEESQGREADLSRQLADVQACLAAEGSSHTSTRDCLVAVQQELAEEKVRVAQAVRESEGQVAAAAAQAAQLTGELAVQRAETARAVEEGSQLRQVLANLTQTLSQEQVASGAVSSQLQSIQQRNSDLEAEVQRLNESGLRVKEELQALSAEYSRECANMGALRQECAQLGDSGAVLQRELEAARGEAGQLREQLVSREAEFERRREEMEQVLDSLKREFEETLAQHAAQMRSRMEQAKQADEEQEQARSQLTVRLATVEGHVSELIQQKCDLLATLDDRLEALEALQQERQALQEQLQGSEATLADESQLLQDAQAQVNKVAQQLREVQEKLGKAESTCSGLEQELEMQRHAAAHTAATASQTQSQQQQQIQALQQDLKKALEQLARQEHEARREVHSLSAQLDTSKREASSLQASLLEEQNEVAALKGDLAKANAAGQDMTERAADLSKRVKELEREKSHLIFDMEQQTRRLSIELQGVKSELASAKDRLEASYKENTSGAVQVAKLRHAFFEMRRVIETVATENAAPTGAPTPADGTPLLSAGRPGSLRSGAPPVSVSPMKKRPSLGGDGCSDTIGTSMRDQSTRSSQSKMAQLRMSLDGMATLLKDTSTN